MGKREFVAEPGSAAAWSAVAFMRKSKLARGIGFLWNGIAPDNFKGQVHKVTLCALASVMVFILVCTAFAQNEDTTTALVSACDRAAGSPSDRGRPAGSAGVPFRKIDRASAMAACEAAAAAAPDTPRIMFQLSRVYFAATAEESARVYVSKASDFGYPAARASLGFFYAAGRGGLTKNDDEALRLFRLAAEEDDPFGYNNLGFFYETGRGGLARDDNEAARYYKLAADNGDYFGQYNLGRFHESGRGGLAADDREAARLFRLAADQGNEFAEAVLGFFYERGRGGLPKDDREAVDLYRRSAEAGNAQGQNNLGWFYQGGRGGLRQSDEEAARLYRFAADKGNAFAQANLGFFYQTGRGSLPQNDNEAASLYRLAAEQGHPFAQNRLAIFYEEGLGGLTKDIGEAIRLYKLAAGQDSNPAIKRRASDALTRLSAATAAIPSARSSRMQNTMPVIGLLNWDFPDRNADPLVAFRQGLAKAGYIEGQNATIEYRWASTQSRRLSGLAMELVQSDVAVIVTMGNTASALAAKAATSKIPIVAEYGGDPVKDDLVASLNQPGRNITGVTGLNTQLGGKRLSLLWELVPEAKTVGFLAGGSDWGTYEEQTSNIRAAARAAGREVIILQAPNDRDYEAAFATLVQRHAGALVVGAFTFRNTDKIRALAERYKIPAIYPGRGYVRAGGLMGYFADPDEVYRQIGAYAGRILKGARPSDLPVVQPTKYHLIVNLKTAKALSLTIPEILLATADEVIE
jgi:TPR repeat protein